MCVIARYMKDQIERQWIFWLLGIQKSKGKDDACSMGQLGTTHKIGLQQIITASILSFGESPIQLPVLKLH